MVETSEINEIVRPLASCARDGMELLRYLMVRAHDGHGLGYFESDLGEELDEGGGKLVLGLVGVTDLIVTQFELHGAPRPTPVVELHVEGLHDIRSGHRWWTRRSLRDQPARETCPSDREGLLEVAAEPRKRLDSRGVEVLGEPGAAPIAQRHRAATLDRPFGEHLADDDQRHPNTTPQGQRFTALHVTDALLKRAHTRRHIGVVHDRISFFTCCHSVVVNSPSPRACLAASRRRSIPIRPWHSRMASATG